MATMTMLAFNTIIIIIVVMSVVVLFIFNFVVACVCFYFKCKNSAKSPDVDRHDVQLRLQQPSPIYDTAVTVNTTLQEKDLEMTENVAYTSCSMLKIINTH